MDPDQFGYKILNNESLSLNGSSIIWPWLLSIGDQIGLFPIVFGDRQRSGPAEHVGTLRTDLPIYFCISAYSVMHFLHGWAKNQQYLKKSIVFSVKEKINQYIFLIDENYREVPPESCSTLMKLLDEPAPRG